MSVARNGGEPYAVWRRGTDDPIAARQWLFRFQEGPKTPEERRNRRLLLCFASGYLALSGLILTLFPAVGNFLPIFGLVFPILGLNSAKQTGALDVAPGPGDAFEARMNVVDQHGITTGIDRGWLIFSEGWLLFEGERTSFAVTRGEAKGRAYGTNFSLTLQDGRSVQFAVTEATDALWQTNSEWNAAPIPDGEAVLPPTDLHPEIWADRWTLSIVGAILCGVFFGFGVGLAAWWVAVPSLLVALACLGFAAHFASRLRIELPRVFRLEAPGAGLSGNKALEKGKSKGVS